MIDCYRDLATGLKLFASAGLAATSERDQWGRDVFIARKW